ncbi:unknown [Prevotella sp. CAG:487]|nr:unknown [Prevotella sp. CAG:487]
MSAGSLSSAKNHAHIHLFLQSILGCNKLYERHAISIREKFLDFLLIVDTLRRSSFHNLYRTLKCFRQFRFVSSSFFL